MKCLIMRSVHRIILSEAKSLFHGTLGTSDDVAVEDFTSTRVPRGARCAHSQGLSVGESTDGRVARICQAYCELDCVINFGFRPPTHPTYLIQH
jgi:hypothetical protein